MEGLWALGMISISACCKQEVHARFGLGFNNSTEGHMNAGM